jgi:multiple sugar transport system substrate-binding protein
MTLDFGLCGSHNDSLILMNKIYFYILVFLIAGCSGASDTVEIRFWAFGAEGEVVERLLPQFEAENPDIRVRVQKIPWTAAHEKLLTAYASNTTPDVAQLGNTWVPEFHMLNALTPLDEMIDGSDGTDSEDFFEGIWNTNVIDGTVFGIPWYVDTRVLFYRKDILEDAGYADPPSTWEELYDLSLRIQERSGETQRYAILLPTNEWVPFVIFCMQSGVDLLRDNNTYGNFSHPEHVKAFEYFSRFFNEGLALIGITQVTNIYQGLSTGFFAMYMSGPWDVGEFRRRMPAHMQDLWMTAPLPGPNQETPGVSIAGGASLVLFRSARNKDAAWKLIEYLARPEVQLEFNALSGNLPARLSAWDESDLKNDPHIRAFYEQLPYVAPLPKVPEWEQIAIKVMQYAEIVSVGRMTVPEALSALDNEINRILDKRRWMLSREE